MCREALRAKAWKTFWKCVLGKEQDQLEYSGCLKISECSTNGCEN